MYYNDIGDFLYIPETIVKEHISPKDFEKPKIEIGNYYLKWDDNSYGIHQKEISDVKGFIKDAVSFFDTYYELLNRFEGHNYKHKEKRHLHKKLSPNLYLSHRSKNHIISYELYMKPDGATFIDRVEDIEMANDDLSNKGHPQGQHIKSVPTYLKWNLGELLFNRQGVDKSISSP
jgi:hypothetical protein